MSVSSPKQLQQTISKAYYNACMAELHALKPGNVHIFADGHGMTVQDFMVSAEVTCDVMSQPNLTLGERILASVQATQNAVSINTNLGIVLLCAPMIQAAYLQNENSLEANLRLVLAQTTIDDSEQVFEAIRLAKPAGLGVSLQHDVHQKPTVNLQAAMQAAQQKDNIAAQYGNNFDAIFRLGLPAYQAALQRLNPSWSTTALYLTLLAKLADSHVARKFGAATAAIIQTEAQDHLTKFNLCDNPKLYQSPLLKWDNTLKLVGLNPGTSADLTVAVLLADLLQQ